MTTPDNELSETTNFGFTRIGPGESLSKNGYAFGDIDRTTLDHLLHAMVLHNHSGEPALGDPTDPPTFTANSTGGHLQPATEYFYRCSFVDRFGLETVASAEGSVTTPNPIAAPSAPAAAVQNSSGTVVPGVYSYMATYFDPYGGETTPSGTNNVQVTNGTTNRIVLNFGAMPAGVTGVNIYRSRPGQSQWYYLGQLLSGSTTVFYDSGEPEDQTITVPTRNTTNSANSIDVTIPLAFIPLGCAAWRIYRATTSGQYEDNSLVHEVIEGDTDASITPRITWTDTGDALLPGLPREASSTTGGGSALSFDDLSGRLPLSVTARGAQCLSAFAPGAITDGETITTTLTPGDVRPVRLTAYFKTPPSSGQLVTFHAVSGAVTVDLPCAGDGSTRYFHAQWPLTDAFQRYMSDSPNNLNDTDLTQYAPYLTVSDSNAVSLITDDASDTGQSLYLDNNGEWGQLDMGTVEPSTYNAYVSIRVNSLLTTQPTDVRVDIYRLDTNVILTSASYVVNNLEGFAETAPLSFTAPGGCEIGIRVGKISTADLQYEVQYARYATTVPDLPAGQLSFGASVSGSGSAADANLALWF